MQHMPREDSIGAHRAYDLLQTNLLPRVYLPLVSDGHQLPPLPVGGVLVQGFGEETQHGEEANVHTGSLEHGGNRERAVSHTNQHQSDAGPNSGISCPVLFSPRLIHMTEKKLVLVNIFSSVISSILYFSSIKFYKNAFYNEISQPVMEMDFFSTTTLRSALFDFCTSIKSSTNRSSSLL